MNYVKDWDGLAGPTATAVFRTHNIDIILAEQHIGYAGLGLPGYGPGSFQLPLWSASSDIWVKSMRPLPKRAILVLTKGSTNGQRPSATRPYRVPCSRWTMALNMIPEKISTRFRIGIIGPGSICHLWKSPERLLTPYPWPASAAGIRKDSGEEFPGPLLYGPGADVPERGSGRGPHLHPHLYL